MSIQITIHGDANEDVQNHLRFLLNSTAGGSLVVTATPTELVRGATLDQSAARTIIDSDGNVMKSSEADHDAATAARERGKPAPGKSRRTKEEIAEDEAADAADAKLSEDATNVGLQANAAGDVKPAISTGDNRVGPDDAQDDADEQAEVEANRKGLTLDDLRKAVGGYQRKFGMTAIVEDVPVILGCKMADVPEGELAAAIAKIEDATRLNPLERFVVGDEPQAGAKTEPETRAYTKADVITAMMAYAAKYDKTSDQEKMAFTMEDCPRVFKMLFGDNVDKLSLIPATSEAFAKAVAGIEEMTAKDPFKRGAK